MKKNIDLTKILKDCPAGTKLYSTIYGKVEFMRIDANNTHPVRFLTTNGGASCVASDGKHISEFDGECTLFPAKDQRDWSKFTAPWYKKDKFDPNTLKSFDKVLVRDYDDDDEWNCEFFSHISDNTDYPYNCCSMMYRCCIPYNDDTKHLVGTTEEAPEYYRYWEK